MRPPFLALATALVAPLLFAAALPAQTKSPRAATLSESERLDAELDALDRDTPVMRELKKLDAEYIAFREREQALQTSLHEQMQKLQDSDAYRAYLKKRAALEDRRQEAWDVERAAMSKAARELYGARHAELRKLAAPPLVEAAGLKFDVLSYPRVDGSTSAHPLSVIVAARMLGVPYEWVYPEPSGHPWGGRPRLQLEDLHLPGRGAAMDFMQDHEFGIATSAVVARPDRPDQERVARMINSLLAVSTSTHDSLVNLVDGKCDLVLTVRPPSASERAHAASKRVEVKLEPVAREALVFIVNQKNPVKGLTLDQIRRVYSAGEPPQWKEFGGKDSPVMALGREPESGSRELFDQLVMKGRPQPERHADMVVGSMVGPFNRVTTDAEAIGYSVYYFDRHMALSPFTRPIAVDGVEPTAASIAAGKYPLVFPLYAAYRAADPPDTAGRRLLAWLVSPEGQSVVRESGYVPLK